MIVLYTRKKNCIVFLKRKNLEKKYKSEKDFKIKKIIIFIKVICKSQKKKLVFNFHNFYYF